MGRNSIGFEIDSHYHKLASERITAETSSLFSATEIHIGRQNSYGIGRELEKRLRGAVQHFWTTRDSQSEKQGAKTGARDADLELR